jgi:hypothetical protein
VNSYNEVKHTGMTLLDVLIEYFKKRMNNIFTILLDILPEGEVQCFDGFDENGEKKWHLERLSDTLNSDNTFSLPIHNYCHHLEHPEEMHSVSKQSTMVYDSQAVLHDISENNINYVYQNGNSASDNTFVGNIFYFYDLVLSVYSASVVDVMTLSKRVQTLHACLI